MMMIIILVRWMERMGVGESSTCSAKGVCGADRQLMRHVKPKMNRQPH